MKISHNFIQLLFYMRVTKEYILIMALIFIWCLLLTGPPVTASIVGSDNSVVKILYRFYSPICHQFDSHSIHIFGYKFAVCARCSSIYFGFFIGGVALLFIKRYHVRSNIKLWMIAALPMIIDVAFDMIGIHSATLLSRVYTGFLFGIAAAIILIPNLHDAINSLSIQLFSFRRSSS
ncbi:MAG: DUF2085 domain-containing protein [Ignavibacteriales bacterium]|nr:DUF2085 domain-containing protein [Ignavibacteriales bacterium]